MASSVWTVNWRTNQKIEQANKQSLSHKCSKCVKQLAKQLRSQVHCNCNNQRPCNQANAKQNKNNMQAINQLVKLITEQQLVKDLNNYYQKIHTRVHDIISDWICKLPLKNACASTFLATKKSIFEKARDSNSKEFHDKDQSVSTVSTSYILLHSKRFIWSHVFPNRYVKEKAYYEKEIAQQSKKIETMVEAKADDHDIQQQKRVLDESKAMIPEVQKLYEKAVADLAKYFKEFAGNAEIAESPCLKDAQQILEENGIAFNKIAPAAASESASGAAASASETSGTAVRR